MGIVTTVIVGFSYLKTLVYKREEKSLEDFYINRFGKKLYSMFFENYTENLWGRHPSEISPEWGAQRVKGLSIMAVLKDIFGKIFNKKNRTVETSLIEEFAYPKLGPGQLWELTAAEFEKMGGKIIKNAKVCEIIKNADNKITGLVYEKDGEKTTVQGDYVISSMPVKDLVMGMNDVPEEYKEIANGLPYRDYMTVGILIPKLNLKNETKTAIDGTEDYQRTYEFWYANPIAGHADNKNGREDQDNNLEPLFTTLKVPGEIDNDSLAAIAEMTIVVEAHAIQAAGFANAEAAWDAWTVNN